MMPPSNADKELTNAKSSPSRRARIETRLRERFSPEMLAVTDESERHSGHAGARPEGETHFRVRMKAAALAALPRVARHRAVTDALKDEFENGLHALALDL
jgi:BolA protein